MYLLERNTRNEIVPKTGKMGLQTFLYYSSHTTEHNIPEDKSFSYLSPSESISTSLDYLPYGMRKRTQDVKKP
jgi:hypothetical protein